MFSSRKAVFDAADIPSTWIFEHYLKLDVKLIGQTHSIKSIFNVNDTIPSFYLYVRSGRYKFKCFSTGKQGDAYELIMLLYGLDFKAAYDMVRDEYMKIEKEINLDISPTDSKWTIINHKVRSHWTKDDAAYWSQYNIGSRILEKYNVRPLGEFTLAKEKDMFTKTSSRAYGYFTASGELYKVYQPNTDRRFFNIKNVVQGWDQVTSDMSRLFVCSSLKDVMSLHSLGITGNIIAPQSETARIDSIKDWVDLHKEKYVIFDNDFAGIKAMHIYEELYNIPYLVLPLSKDISDSVKDYGARKVKAVLLSMLEK